MKLTQAQAIELLKSAGLVDAEVVADEAESTYNLDDALGSIDTTRSQILEPKFTAKMQEDSWKNASAKYGSAMRKLLAKSSGLSRSQLDKIEDDEAAISKAFEHYTQSVSGDANETKKRLDEIIEAHNAEKEQLISQHTEQLTAEKNIRLDRYAQDYIADVLKDAPFPNKADRNILAKDYYNYLKAEYLTQYDEDGKKINLFDKSKPTFPAMNGNVPVDLKEKAKEFFTPRGQWETDMRNVNPAEAMRNIPTQEYNAPKQLNPNDPNQTPALQNEAIASFLKQQGVA